MALSIDRLTNVINVPQADLTLVSAGIYQLNVDAFRLALKAIEDDEPGMPFKTTHQHNTVVTVGGVTLARVVEIINGYTVTFEDGQYAVNLVGANNNLADVANVNQVSIRSANSAGLIQISTGSGLSAMEQNKLDELWRLSGCKAGEPLIVSDTGRSTGAMVQTITRDGSTTTVERA